MQWNQCPRCQKSIPSHRQLRGLSVCECGWIGSIREQKLELQTFNRTTFALILLSALIIASFIHIVKWDKEGASALRVQTLELIGMATVEDFREFERICSSRKMHDCTQDSIQKQIDHGTQDTEIQARLGKLFFQKKDKANAYKAFTNYFTQRGRDIEAAFMFSVLLHDLNSLDQAVAYLQFVLKHDKEQKYHLQATRAYVKILVAKQNFQQAKEMIFKVRAEDQKANMFMEDTLQLIQDQLSSKTDPSVKTPKKKS